LLRLPGSWGSVKRSSSSLSGYTILQFYSPTEWNRYRPANRCSRACTQQADNRIFAQLDKLTHAKRVKSGDAVSAHLVAPAKLPNGTELQKGHEACRNHHRRQGEGQQGRPVENGLVVHNRGAKGGQGDDCLDGIGQSRAAPATERC